MMARNKMALLRYHTIDECLQNRFRKWTLQDLMKEVSHALYEKEGIATGVSKRTIQSDLQLMRSDKLGYRAPIVVVDSKYYTYEDANFRLNTTLSEQDLDKLKDALSLLSQLRGFGFDQKLQSLVASLEDHVESKDNNNSSNFVHMEQNDLLKGASFLSKLHEFIKKKKSLLIEYQSFKSEKPTSGIYYPYLLKEHRNRWFLISAKQEDTRLVTLALDRIMSFHEVASHAYVDYKGIDFQRYYRDAIGVTKNPTDRARKVVLFVDKKNAPYVITKPLHHSQRLTEQKKDGITVRLDVVLNFELEKEILSLGEAVKVLYPFELKKRIKTRIDKMRKLYLED